ncbi:hypothetical protein HELRODRAFT_166945 [Helobdella robusta]|uniref:Uncharacterized protein n=1 Tax=Helobdella robusta TaxID=6412 RepID=T1EYS6_HELRO|nr:hypothetical protein HELRODRAFT_166945 [Helobdella robusta]ESO11868.1 hypothetical protein HELRODRAFT_166945 [Helobdella robusta]
MHVSHLNMDSKEKETVVREQAMGGISLFQKYIGIIMNYFNKYLCLKCNQPSCNTANCLKKEEQAVSDDGSNDDLDLPPAGVAHHVKANLKFWEDYTADQIKALLNFLFRECTDEEDYEFPCYHDSTCYAYVLHDNLTQLVCK